jgi:hypothetical protein
MATTENWLPCWPKAIRIRRGRKNYQRRTRPTSTWTKSKLNHTFVRQQLHALSVIPAKRGKKTWRIHGVRAQMRADFPRKKYCRRALIETVCCVAKRKLSCRAPGRCLLTQRREALLLGLSYNLYRL